MEPVEGQMSRSLFLKGRDSYGSSGGGTNTLLSCSVGDSCRVYFSLKSEGLCFGLLRPLPFLHVAEAELMGPAYTEALTALKTEAHSFLEL